MDSQTVLVGLLLHPDETAVLVAEAEGGVTLPHTTVTDEIWAGYCADLIAYFGTAVGATCYALRMAYNSWGHTKTMAFVLALTAEGWQPPTGYRWLAATEIEALTDAAQRGWVNAVLTDTVTPPQRAPWARGGWYAEMRLWVEEALASQGRALNGPLTQLRSWAISTIWRAPTASGDVYFKASARLPLFAAEAAVVNELSALFPRHIAKPLAIDAARNWLLTADFGESLGERADVATQAAVFTAFAELQVAAAAEIDRLFEVGCLDRRLPVLAEQIGPLFDYLGEQGTAERDQLALLHANEGRLIDMCDELAALPIPDSLVHGDLHTDNAATWGNSFLFYDWSDACVSHPFIDMFKILEAEEPAVQGQLRDAYLRPWEAVAPRRVLLAGWKLARPLVLLHQLVSYQHILQNVEAAARAELTVALPYFLEMLLPYLDRE